MYVCTKRVSTSTVLFNAPKLLTSSLAGFTVVIVMVLGYGDGTSDCPVRATGMVLVTVL
jgi:hypothetical protein